MMEKVGFIGLGTMGGRAARKIVEGGYQVLGHDTDKNACTEAKQNGVEIANDLRAMKSVRIVILSLPGPPEVEQVVSGSDSLIGHLESEAVIVDLSSVDAQTAQTMAQAASSEGLFYLDAPVLGRPPAVGNWILPVGGDKSALERVQKVLSCIASKTVYMGDSGSGSAVKLLNNLMVGAMNAVIAEAMALSHRVGLSPRSLLDIIGSSKAPTNNLLFQVKGKKIVENDYSPSFKLDLLAKDNDLCVKMAAQLGVPLMIGRSVDSVNKLAQLQGLGSYDTSILYNYFKKVYGIEGTS
jgi:3-hydroxyisobutyrate dehydrogenase-like beta-hydroxyacid dehydrogenase